MSQPTPKKVLVVSWHFPPYKSSSAFNLFKRLKDTGYEYDVLQIKRADKPDNEGMFRYAASRFNRYEIEVLTEDARDPEARAHYVEKVLDFYRRLKDHNHYRVMVSHSHEVASHLAAMAIKKANPELRWVASFGDPIAANPFNDSYRFPMLEEDSRTEAEVLQQADRIIITNPYQQAAVTEGQTLPVDSSKFFVLPHCFDERMYPRQTTPAQPVGQSEGQGRVFRFMHVGMLYKFKRTAEPFMRGAQRLLEKHPELKGHFTLEFYGANDRYIQAAADYGLEGIASFKGTVNYLESLAMMTRADCLLLRDADFSDQGLRDTPFYPGKLADYLGAKKPVLAVTMAHGCVPDMLAKLGGASLAEDDIDGIADAMWAAIQGRLAVNAEEAERYSHYQAAERARQALSFPEDKKKILIAGHDLKFAKFIMDAIEQRDDLELLVDQWQGHSKHDEERSHQLLSQADTIFCEWGLGNVVWYSRHKKAGQKLVTRVHAQELKTRHLNQCVHENIDNYIFVSPYYFELMIAEFSLRREKCKMLFNMVDTELLDKPKLADAGFHLGMIGDVPQSKRLDRALDIFEKLYAKDKRYKLFVKGKRPEDYPWMHSRKPEMDYYRAQYKRIEDSGWKNNVIFDGYGPIDTWLQKIGWILSVSDHESFHLAVAEGIASGAKPSILNWPGSETIYFSTGISSSVDEMAIAIHQGIPQVDIKLQANIFNKDLQSNKTINILEGLVVTTKNLPCGLSKEWVDQTFNSTWFGKSLIAGSGARLWRDGSVCILNQPPYQLEIPINWLDDPYNHRSWRWILNAFQWMDQLLARFKLNQDEVAVQACVTYFLDWANFYITGEREGEFLWKDDAVSFRTFRLSIIAAYIFESGNYTDEEKVLTEQILHKHYLELSNPKKFKSNNHGIFQMRALMSLLTLHPGVGDISDSQRYVAKRLNWLWTRQYGTQNIHLENSTGYHQYIIKEFEEILDSPELKGLSFLFNKKTIKEVKDNAKYLFHPNGTGTLFGDSNFVQQEHEVVTGDHIFNEAGYAILAGNEPTKNNSYLAMRTGFPSNAHRHADDFSFEWSEKGQVILQDSGRYSYDYNDPFRMFVSSTRAHNTVSVNGGNYPWWGEFKKTDFYEGAVKQYHGCDKKVSLLLERFFSSPDVFFCRSIELTRGKLLKVVDKLSSRLENQYEQWFHLAKEFEYSGEQNDGSITFKSESVVVNVRPPKGERFVVVRGQEEKFIQGWVSYREKEILPRWSFGVVSSKLKNKTFETVFEILSSD